MTKPFRLGNVGLRALERELVRPAEDVPMSGDKINYLTPEQAVEAIDRVAGKHLKKAQRPGDRPTPALARSRDLTDAEREQVRQRSIAGIVKPHRLPWVGKSFDLSDIPCSCSRTTPCGLHAHELGGPRPYLKG